MALRKPAVPGLTNYSDFFFHQKIHGKNTTTMPARVSSKRSADIASRSKVRLGGSRPVDSRLFGHGVPGASFFQAIRPTSSNTFVGGPVFGAMERTVDMSELEEPTRALPMVGAERTILDDERIAHIVGHGHRILSRRSVPGLNLEVEETPDAIVGKLIIQAGVTIAHPIHMCFGLAHPTGSQRIHVDVRVEKGAAARVLAHCLFPVAQAAEHRMQAKIDIGPDASLTYTEGHYHSPHGGMEVLPHATIRIGKGARYFSDFSLLSCSVGSLDVDYSVEA